MPDWVLDLPQPGYLHIPLVFGKDGRKLSKSDDAHPVDCEQPLRTLLDAWRHLGQPTPAEDDMTLPEFLAWATDNWQPRQMTFQAESAL